MCAGGESGRPRVGAGVGRLVGAAGGAPTWLASETACSGRTSCPGSTGCGARRLRGAAAAAAAAAGGGSGLAGRVSWLVCR